MKQKHVEEGYIAGNEEKRTASIVRDGRGWVVLKLQAYVYEQLATVRKGKLTTLVKEMRTISIYVISCFRVNNPEIKRRKLRDNQINYQCVPLRQCY